MSPHAAPRPALPTAHFALSHPGAGLARSDTLLDELRGIVGDIRKLADEARVVSFNAQVVAARAGPSGREFAVVANVLSDITTEIDGLTRKAANLAQSGRAP